MYLMRVLIHDVPQWIDLNWKIVGMTWVSSLRCYDVLLRLDSDVAVTPNQGTQ